MDWMHFRYLQGHVTRIKAENKLIENVNAANGVEQGSLASPHDS